ncbi:MAG: hypothetical protein QXV74_03900 [Candidatus Bathyarchaeia archaeon]
MHREVRRLLVKALHEPDPERAVELFLAARLLYTALNEGGEPLEKPLEEILRGLGEIRGTLQTLLRNPSK